MAAKLDWSTFILLFAMITFGKCCKSDPMDALFVSTEIGRGTNHFFSKCADILFKMNPYPSSPLIVKFLKSVCEAIDVCEHLLHTQDVKANIPCLRQLLWARWLGSKAVPVEQMKIVEEAALCGASALSTTRVAKHLLAYGLKITG
ncbi:uncharacterized protein LOC144119198 [Amblyomma americanum]